MHQARDIVNVEPLHQLGTVGFDGLGTETEAEGDLLGVVALGDKREDFALAASVSEQPDPRMRPRARNPRPPVSTRPGQVHVAPHHHVQRQLELDGRRILEKISDAPSRNARITYCFSACIESMITRRSGNSRFAAAIASRPLCASCRCP